MMRLFRSYGIRMRMRAHSTRARELQNVCSDGLSNEEYARYVELREKSLEWAIQDLHLAIADIFDPPEKNRS